MDAKKEKHEKAFGDVHGKDAKVKAELDEVEVRDVAGEMGCRENMKCDGVSAGDARLCHVMSGV